MGGERVGKKAYYEDGFFILCRAEKTLLEKLLCREPWNIVLIGSDFAVLHGRPYRETYTDYKKAFGRFEELKKNLKAVKDENFDSF